MGAGQGTVRRPGAGNPYAKKKRGQEPGQGPLGAAQRLSVNARSVGQVGGAPHLSDGPKALGGANGRTRSIQPSKARLHLPFDPGCTTDAYERRGMANSPGRGPGATESAQFFGTLQR